MSEKRTDTTSPAPTAPKPRLRDTLALAARFTIDWIMLSAFVSMLLESNHTPDEIHDWFLDSFVTFSGVPKAEVAHAARLTAIQKLNKAKRRATTRRTSWIPRARTWIKE